MTVEDKIIDLMVDNPDNYLLMDVLEFYVKHGFLLNSHYTAIQKDLRDPTALVESRGIHNFGMVI